MRGLRIVLLAVLLWGCEGKEEHYRPTGENRPMEAYVFGVHPYKNTQAMYAAFNPIMRYLEAHIPGLALRLETANNYAHYEEKLYAGGLDFALPNPYQSVTSLNYGYRVIAKMAPDEVFRGIFVARKDRNLTSPQQLRGEKVSFPAPTALAATLMPLWFLHSHGVDVRTEITPVYAGSQDSSIMNAYAGITAAGGTWPPPWELWSKQNPIEAAQMEVVWQTDPLPNNGVVVHNRVPAVLAQAVARVLVQMADDPEGKKLLEAAGFEGFEPADNATYDPVRRFLETYDRTLGLPRQGGAGAKP